MFQVFSFSLAAVLLLIQTAAMRPGQTENSAQSTLSKANLLQKSDFRVDGNRSLGADEVARLESDGDGALTIKQIKSLPTNCKNHPGECYVAKFDVFRNVGSDQGPGNSCERPPLNGVFCPGSLPQEKQASISAQARHLNNAAGAHATGAASSCHDCQDGECFNHATCNSMDPVLNRLEMKQVCTFNGGKFCGGAPAGAAHEQKRNDNGKMKSDKEKMLEANKFDMEMAKAELAEHRKQKKKKDVDTREVEMAKAELAEHRKKQRDEDTKANAKSGLRSFAGLGARSWVALLVLLIDAFL